MNRHTAARQRRGARRLAIVLVTAAAAGVALSAQARLRYLTTAHQLGIVGFRDPVGATSPDGRWLAYTEGRALRVMRVEGGAVITFPPAAGQIRHLAWRGTRVVAEDPAGARRWWEYDPVSGQRTPLWPDRRTVTGRRDDGATAEVAIDELRQLTWSADGRRAAALGGASGSTDVWRIEGDGGRADVRRVTTRVSFPAWAGPEHLACIATTGGRPRLTLPCGEAPVRLTPDVDVYGPLAFAPGADVVYFASPNDRGTVDLWRARLASGQAERHTAFERDTYQPSVSADGTVTFKVQDYRTHVATVPAEGGPARTLTTFQSETPSWNPSGTHIGVTYGTWRRIVDDINYPDIAQEVGLVDARAAAPADEPSTVVALSSSEDQSMCWSPNGKWIVLHSHKEMSDDLWLMAADLRSPDRRITFLGRGAETGWPRWSADGRWVTFDAASRRDGHGAIYVMGIDQETGTVTQEAQEVAISGVGGDSSHAEWLPDSETLVVHAVAAAGEHVLFTVPRGGGAARIFHRYASEHTAPGLGVSPDGRWAAFVAPAADGFLQLFRVPVAGGTPEPLTVDPSHKTQPAYAPDGSRIALTIWRYDAQFWSMRP